MNNNKKTATETLGDYNTAKSALYQYYFRALICFSAAGTLASLVNWENINPLYAGMIVLLLAYTYAAFWLSNKYTGPLLSRITRCLQYSDAFLIGIVVGITDFSIVSSILFLAMIQFNALLAGGLKKWAEDNIAFALGAGLSLLIHEPQLVLNTNFQISAASFIGILTYFLAYAFYTHTRVSQLENHLQLLELEDKKHKVRAYKLSRYISPQVCKAINKGQDKILQAERKRLSIFFSDVKDFSQLSEEMEAEALTELLNNYLSEMSKIAMQFGGTIDKFMGDGIMIIFGDDNSKGVKADCLRCIAMAIAMRKRMKSLQHEWQNKGIKRPLQIRMGINTGYCTVGTFGTTSHLDYTVLGTHVNLASRLESAATPGEILISHESWALTKDAIMCRDKGDIRVKGFSHTIKVYQVMDFRRDLGKNDSFLEHTADGFSIHLDLDKVHNFDKEQVLKTLEKAADKLRGKVIV
tara:strand:+ start:760 stop:2160 length:1401 start_codon:yes stop_codon:yes gene_type:complete